MRTENYYEWHDWNADDTDWTDKNGFFIYH